MKILLLEKDEVLNVNITNFLIAKGHRVKSFNDGSLAKASIEKYPYDLLLLSINVPKIDGLKLLEELHAEKIYIHTIYISSVTDIEKITQAFDLGCQDYLKKPFHLKELDLRIEKLFHSTYVPSTHIRLSKNYSLDVENKMLLFDGEVEQISQRHLKILTLLAHNRNRVVGYYLFQEYAWDGAEVEIPTIRTEINRIKKLLKEEVIFNIRNMGYIIKTAY